MISSDAPFLGPWGVPHEDDPRCEQCGRSLVGRFGGVPEVECQSCQDEFRRLAVAGKIVDEGGAVIHFEFPEAA